MQLKLYSVWHVCKSAKSQICSKTFVHDCSLPLTLMWAFLNTNAINLFLVIFFLMSLQCKPVPVHDIKYELSFFVSEAKFQT